MRFIRAVTLLAIAVLVPLFVCADTTGSVRGFIRCIDCLGQPPIQGVVVTVFGPNGVWKSTTDAHGFYVIFGITSGRYKISVYDKSLVYLQQRLRSVHPLCMHAGDTKYVNLYLGHSIGDPIPSLVKRGWRQMERSIGDC